ncbi:MAG: zinc ribbon domain-containing protein [Chloroflexi bacterium]|nr:zinc ribbon domain-containing protein [Chloroflexota bacterium]
MRAVGVLLLVLGIVGLLLNLILWLPVGFNVIIVALVSAVCFTAIWGGGRLSQARTEFVTEPAKKYEPTAQQPQWVQQSVACPKCGCHVVPGQRFCGGCGSSLESYCARCGGAITAPSRFCGNCGAKLS